MYKKLPRFLARLICAFIPSRRARHAFMQKYARGGEGSTPSEKYKGKVLYILGRSTIARSDYLTHSNLKNELCQVGGNSGNMVFERAMERYFTSPSNFPCQVEDSISEHGQKAAAVAVANLLNSAPSCVREMDWLASRMCSMKSPVYFIGFGAQSTYDYSFDFLDDIKDTARRFIRSVYDTGGGFALRGHFTAECFERLGFRDYEVLGCPSLYINGGDFRMGAARPASKKDFRPVVNGYIKDILLDEKNLGMMKKYPHSAYVCQDELFNVLFRGADLPGMPAYARDMMSAGRVKLFMDVDDWSEFMRQRDFVFGARIHGAIMGILNGVPAFMSGYDSRTRELCEFFGIPHAKIEDYSKVDLHGLYLSADYSEFNAKYAGNFRRFKEFFDKRGIPNSIGGKNEFFDWLVANCSQPNLWECPGFKPPFAK